MTYVLFSIIIFLVLQLIFIIFYRNKIGKKEHKLSEIRYFVKKFGLNRNLINLKKFYNGISLINSLILLEYFS